MTSDTLSFRITRNTEDLAQTIHSLSQRLVKLEQRLAAMEQQLDRQERTEADRNPEELVCLDNVERLLADCRELLAIEGEHESAASFADCDSAEAPSETTGDAFDATPLAA